ncbi:MAG: vitamin B12 dependent methionine synthase [Deltaproteobacteria bacterium]|nr:vitamin B12 dependent methionine synthase [Deltaproteobacteria bacterium]MBW1923573.1 vitamin B12 dependent methionine synthase [Deltaproteobacteria bacterium]MBW1948565.1 vitamin B12 dependent methionine synthase [Deltaproteobacteria bacterium]MBW2006759.1 vitamin B12 dependent methionine synthase [Deltaproteobacteria bacterium]MBW2101684.1 vitamin B12 dependent methionine synthase [Deltaproteobacteria bacterium]
MPLITEDIPITLDPEGLRKSLPLGRREHWEELLPLVDKAQRLIHPRVTFRPAYIDEKEEGAVRIEGLLFQSRVLRKNLDQVQRVFPYVITLGPELEAEARTSEDILHNYYLDIIGNMALSLARARFEKGLRKAYRLEGVSFMSPGSLQDWGLEEQGPLFSLLGDVYRAIGVRLTESFLMLPRKSLSGLYFPTEIPFYSCQLCPRKSCPGRRAPFDPEVARAYDIPLAGTPEQDTET